METLKQIGIYTAAIVLAMVIVMLAMDFYRKRTAQKAGGCGCGCGGSCGGSKTTTATAPGTISEFEYAAFLD